MNLKVLELVYKDDFKSLNDLFKSQLVHPDAPINDVLIIKFHSFT